MKKEQSCRTCKFGRFNSSGVMYCHGGVPTPIMKPDGSVNGYLAPVNPDFWGCRVYTFTTEKKFVPDPPPQVKEN